MSKARIVATTLLFVFWMMGATPFVLQTVSFEVFNKVWPYISLLADGILLCLGVWLVRRYSDVLWLAAFVVITVASTYFINNMPPMFWLNGLRYYLPMLLLPSIYRYLTANPARAEYFIVRFDSTLFAFLALQFPCMVVQLLLYGAGDYGGGSLGNLNSGTISTTIYMISFYLMIKRWDREKEYFANLKHNWPLLVCLIPTFLNETKISFVYLFMYFLMIIPFDKRFVKSLIYLVPGLILIIGGGLAIYIKVVPNATEIFNKENLEFYLMGDEDTLNLLELYFDKNSDTIGDDGDLARGAKFAAMPYMVADAPWGTMWGYGIGQFKGGTIVEKSGFAKRYDYILDGTNMQGMVWQVDMGIVGMIWCLGYMAYVFGFFKRKNRGAVNLNLRMWLLIVFVLVLVYNALFLSVPFCIIYFYLVMISDNWPKTQIPEVKDMELLAFWKKN